MIGNCNIILFEDDLPDGLELGDEVAVDTEAMGLNIHNDRLCLVQIATSSGKCFLIKIGRTIGPAPNLKKVLSSSRIAKIFHFARFDVALLNKAFDIRVDNIFCTKIASRLARSFTNKHGLKDLCYNLLGIELVKQQQTSDWGKNNLTQEQLKYAADDVLYLHRLKEILLEILVREGRDRLACDCFKAIGVITSLDAVGINFDDLFSH
ncbi:MAG: ribonuclease D [Holosporales bacterium]|jgi:ribonuclease D|nr:ribonuclease D [Holosporales bacterium]